jgi:hypothetical protein
MGQNIRIEEIENVLLQEGIALVCEEHLMWLTTSVPSRTPPTNLVFPSKILYDN